MRARFLGFALLIGAGAAFAQAPAQPSAAQGGFFQPAPDVSLTNPRPAAQPVQRVDPQAPREVALEAPGQSDAVSVMRWTEEQMDRSTLESDRARQQAQMAPQPINGAFDGTTSERNR